MHRALAAAAMLILALPALAQEASFRRITVTPTAEGYACDSEMRIPVPPELAWEVMTDFDSMAAWVPNLRSSRVVSREDRTVVIEQVGNATFGPLSFDFTMERRLALDPPRGMTAVQTKGTLRKYSSMLRIAPERGATRLRYRVDIEPGLLLGAILSKEFVEHELKEQFTAIAAEMQRRYAALQRAEAGTSGAGR